MKVVERKISELIPAEYNPRYLSDEANEQLKASLKRFGAVDPAIINTHPDRLNIIVGGHQRLKVAQSIGWEEFPCVEVNLDPQKERELNIRLNKNTGAWDWDSLANYFESEDLIEWGFTTDELFGGDEVEELEAEEDDYEIPEEVQSDFVLGDLIEIGEHRLLCGDSTDSDQVAKLMNGEKADMVFTDPPYNVDYGNSNNPRHKSRTILNDKKTEGDWDDFVISYMSNLLAFTDGNIYISMSDKELGHMQLAFEQCGGRWASFIIWVKDRLVLSGKDYHTRHETILYGWNEKVENRLRVEDRKQDDVWEIKRPSTSDLHPTMKPIELIERMLTNSTRKGMDVLDLFLGSGSTMVACHQLKRKCYGMELDPKYCQVIVDRMIKLDPSLEIKLNGNKYESESN